MPSPQADLDRGREALVAMRIDEAVTSFEAALRADPGSIAAHLGLYEAYQVKGNRPLALEHQRKALERQRLYVEKAPAPGAPTILLLAIAGDWQANVPLEYVYPSLSPGVFKLFVDEQLPNPQALPGCDLVFNAIAQSDRADATLEALAAWKPQLRIPFLNDPAKVRKLSRDGVARDFADLEGALVPNTRRVPAAALSAAVAGATPEAPFTVRAADSQAGETLGRIENPAALAPYLAQKPGTSDYFVAPFVDYRSADGFFRKYRIIFVDGVPFAHHLAISRKWMVHYYNALNDEEAWIREEEERFLAGIEHVFDGPRKRVLDELARRVGLDYFGIDCGVLPDGRVLIFEIDVAMIVHLGDPIERYPYKHAYVPRIFDAFERMIYARSGRQPPVRR
ncbi:MAG: RimK family alpha-L-glutamate ligase [Candidatus Eremiobacteraeota bacterium]|nr:RimK family alpha-L-glutamate ligase [Candidatus Eremiobacteraeota bacterium]